MEKTKLEKYNIGKDKVQRELRDILTFAIYLDSV